MSLTNDEQTNSENAQLYWSVGSWGGGGGGVLKYEYEIQIEMFECTEGIELYTDSIP